MARHMNFMVIGQYIYLNSTSVSYLYLTFLYNAFVPNLNNKHDKFHNFYVIFSSKVKSVYFNESSNQLISTGDDAVVAFWDMSVKHLEVIFTT